MQQTLEQLVVEQQQSSGLVGLGAVIMKSGQITGSAISGEKKIRSNTPLTTSDYWHIGSITKSITATMVARLVEKGDLNWDTTVKEVFHDAANLHKDWRNVSLMQLLTHTSGAQPNFPFLVRLKKPDDSLQLKVARESAVTNQLKKEPASSAGSTFVYSNVGYTIAGVMAEKITGRVWEDLVTQEVFTPLGLESAGFGAPNSDTFQHPRGHRTLFGIKMAAGADEDNTPIMGPAGTVHMSLTDLATYGYEHLKGKQGTGKLLNQNTYQTLHTPSPPNDYALGWVIDSSDSLNVGDILWHNGSNTMWYALLVIVPSIDIVIAISSNEGDVHTAETSAWNIVRTVVGKVCPAGN